MCKNEFSRGREFDYRFMTALLPGLNLLRKEIFRIALRGPQISLQCS